MVQQEEETIQNLWMELSDALRDKDWERYSSLWVQDSTLQVIHPETGSLIEGWVPFREQYQPLLESNIDIDFRLGRFDVTVGPNGEVAWATIENTVIMNDRPQPTWQLAVFRKVDDQWRVNVGFSSSVSPRDQPDE